MDKMNQTIVTASRMYPRDRVSVSLYFSSSAATKIIRCPNNTAGRVVKKENSLDKGRIQIGEGMRV